MSINPLNDISKVYLEKVAAQQLDEVSADLALKASKEAGKRAGVLAGLSGGDPKVAAKARKKRVQAERLYSKQAKKRVVNVTPIKEEESEFEIEEGMTLKDYKKKRSALKQKEKRAADKISPGRRAGIHADKASPERAARHRANVDPDYDRDDEGDMYPGGKLKNPKKIRKAKALGELGESSVPGKPAEKLGAVTSIPKAERDAARERVLAKAKAMREKRGIKTEAVKGADPEMRKAASAERKSGDKRLSPSTGKGYADQQKQSIAYMDKLTKKNKNVVGLVTKEALDPVGKEDADVDNDGKKNTNADKYLLKRRKAIGKAISTHEEKEVKRWWDDDGDGKGYEEGEVSGKFKKKKKTVKEGFSNWREDLVEVMDVIGKEENEGKITEKKVKNKIKINPSMGEAVENLGGTLLEMVEIDEVDYIVESVYDELLEEGYEEDDIEEAIEYALTEAKVTYGHDTSAAGTEKKKEGLLSIARKKLSGLNKSAKQALATGARKVAKGALGVARKMEGGDKTPSAAHTGTRKASTYRGAGVGQKEKVSSGSYKGPEKKTTEKPSDPWEGSATTPAKPKPKPKAKAPAAKAKTTKVSGGTAKAPAKRKKTSKLDDLLASVRSEEVQIDEKTLTTIEKKKREEIAQSMNLADFERRYPGRGMEVKMATATKIAKKVSEQALEMQPRTSETSEKPDQQKKKTQQQQDRMRQQEVQILQRKLQALRSAPKGTDPSITAGYEPEGDVIDERRREEKGTPRKPRDPAFEFIAKKMGSSRMGVQPRGEKKEKGKKPPTDGEYGGPASPAQKVAKRRAAAQRSQDMMHSRFD